jgi:hypothetical protein
LPKTPEGEIKKEIVAWLNGLGGVVEPLKTGLGQATRSHYKTPKISNGRPDLLLLLDSKAIAIEVKADTAQRPSQVEWMRRWMDNGGYYFLAYSLDDVKSKIKTITGKDYDVRKVDKAP